MNVPTPIWKSVIIACFVVKICSAQCVGSCATNADSTGASHSHILAGNENSISSTNSAILAGQRNTIKGGHSFIGVGLDNTISGNSHNVITGGSNNNIIGSRFSAHIGSGRHNSIFAHHSVTVGSFTNATHIASIVVGAVGDGTDLPDGAFPRCQSQGDETISFCTGTTNGFFVNKRNILQELIDLQIELNSTKAALSELTTSVLPECIQSRRRRVLTNCFASGSPTTSPTLEGYTSFVGKTLIENNPVRVAAGKDVWEDDEIRALFEADIKTREQLCASEREEYLNLGFTPGKTTDLFSLFLCDESSPSELSPGDLAAIISTVIAVLGFLTCLCQKEKIAASFPRSSKEIESLL